MKWPGTAVLAAFALLACIAPPASAGWQYAQWGMSAAEVARASAGRASAIADSEQESRSNEASLAKLTAAFKSGSLAFRADFLFDRGNERLNRVALKLDDGSRCASLQESLAQKYGKPLESLDEPAIKRFDWHDKAKGNGVRYVYIGPSSCFLDYFPLANEDNQGL